MVAIKIKTSSITIISVFACISLILSSIRILPFINGGGVTLFGMLPIMLLSFMVGKKEAIICGFVFGCIELLSPAFVCVHPLQFMLDYILPSMALGLASVFGNESRFNMNMGILLAITLKLTCHIISGIFFFGQYAPEGVGAITYSVVYNVLGTGVEGVLTLILFQYIKINRFKKVLNLN